MLKEINREIDGGRLHPGFGRFLLTNWLHYTQRPVNGNKYQSIKIFTQRRQTMHPFSRNLSRLKKLVFQVLFSTGSSLVFLALGHCTRVVVNDLVTEWLAWTLVHWASEVLKKLLAWKENLLAPDDRTEIFPHLHVINRNWFFFFAHCQSWGQYTSH